MTRFEPQEQPGDGPDVPTVDRRTVMTAVGLTGLAGLGLDPGRPHGRVRASSHEWRREAKLVASDAEPGATFGYSVALDGDRALVGARYDSETVRGGGAAYVFEFDGRTGVWEEVQKLTPSDAARLDEFGFSVALDGSRALVGAPGGVDTDQGGAGSAYVFERGDDGDWPATEDWQLTGSDVGADDAFGASVALDGSYALVGKPGFARDSPGATYVFEQREDGAWPPTEDQRLAGSDASDDDWFGMSVAIDGPQAVVGAPLASETAETPGASYLLSRSEDGQWGEEGRFAGSDAGPTFGFSVDVDGASTVVGAWGDDERAENAGAAYFQGPLQRRKFTASDAAAGDLLGVSVALDGSSALVGSAGDFDTFDVEGAAYRFDVTADRSTEQQRFAVPDVEPEDTFGWAVDLDGKRALVSAATDDEHGAGAGAVHVFSTPREATPTATATDETATSRSEDETIPGEPTSVTPTETSTRTGGNGGGSTNLPGLSAAGLIGFAVGFLTGNAEDTEIKKKSLGLLTVVFGGGGVFGLLQSSATVGWLVVAGAVGVVVGVLVGTGLRRAGFSFAR